MTLTTIDDALRRIPSTNKRNFSIRLSQFSCDVDEQSALRSLDSILTGEFQHLDTILNRGAVEMLVRIGTRQHENDFIDDLLSGFGQSQMSSRDGVERAGKHADTFH